MCTMQGFKLLTNYLLSATRCQKYRFYAALFGVSYSVTQIVWAKIRADLPQQAINFGPSTFAKDMALKKGTVFYFMLLKKLTELG